MRKKLAKILEDITSGSVAVVGDLMLDEYIIGDSHRISPEAPEPIIEEEDRDYIPGGAANVAANITSLGGCARLYGIVGEDTEGIIFRRVLNETGVSDENIITVQNLPTTRKTRLIARGNQVLRIDREKISPLDKTTEDKIAEGIISNFENIVVISDYSKGLVTHSLIKRLTKTSKKILIDPKSSDFSLYRGAFLLTPNLAELCRACGVVSLSLEEAEKKARALMEKYGIRNILVTLGAEGMLLVEKESAVHIHTRAREVYDVTGAGDTVIATIASALAGGVGLQDACAVANIAAGIVVGKRKTSKATPGEIMSYAFGPTSSEKIIEREILCQRVAQLKKAGKKVVFTNGCFDLLHIGHITYLNEARGLGDILVVGLNTDRSVRALKGQSRPIIPENERSHVLAALECVDYVVMFDEDTPEELINAVLPDILVKGGDYTVEQVVGRQIVESHGGQVALIPFVDNRSTTSLINRIRGLS